MLAAAIATWAGGPEGWRWAWYLLGIPVALVAIVAFKMKEPPRGQFEKDDVLGEVIEDENPAPISMEAAFARIKKIKTIKTVLVAFCALGFGLFSQGELASLYLNDNLRIHDVLTRGLILSLSGIAALPILPFVGKYFDKVYRVNPAKALALVGALILPSALFTPLQYSVHSSAWFWILGIPQAVLTTSAFAMTAPVLQAVVPYRLRGMGTAMATMYIFFIGGFLGGVLSGFFTNAIGIRGTVIAIGVPTSIIGGLMLMNGARFIRGDLSLVVEELLEEQEEHRKRERARRGDARAAGCEHRLLVRHRAGPVRRQLRDRTRRVRRAARYERRGKVHDPACHQRARGPRTRRRAPRRPQHHLRRPGVTGEARHRVAARWQRDVPGAHRGAEPRR